MHDVADCHRRVPSMSIRTPDELLVSCTYGTWKTIAPSTTRDCEHLPSDGSLSFPTRCASHSAHPGRQEGGDPGSETRTWKIYSLPQQVLRAMPAQRLLRSYRIRKTGFCLVSSQGFGSLGMLQVLELGCIRRRCDLACRFRTSRSIRQL